MRFHKLAKAALALGIFATLAAPTASFAAAAATAKGGVLLIDEIESALHRDTLRKIFGHLLRESAALDVQIFATTHSLEALDAILAEATEEFPLVVYNLSPAGAHRTPLNRLRTIREEHGLDIR